MNGQILIVEDQKNWYTVIRDILIREGYTVTVKSNRLDAEEILNNSTSDEIYALIVNLNLDLDFPVPDGSGYRILEIAGKNYPKVPKVVLTAIDDVNKATVLVNRYNVIYLIQKNNFDITELYNALNKIKEVHHNSNGNHTSIEPASNASSQTNPLPNEETPFDVFLCYNNKDRAAVIRIAKELKKLNIKLWLDEWNVPPGSRWIEELDKNIERVKTTAVFIGPDGIGPWQNMEIHAFLTEFVIRELPVIPVILPGGDKFPKLPLFLKGFKWVDFRESGQDSFRKLVWGITNKRIDILNDEFSGKIDAQELTRDIQNLTREELERIKQILLTKSDFSTLKILDRLEASQIAVIHTLHIAVENAQLPPTDWEELLNVIRDLRQNPPKDQTLATALQSLPATVDDPQSDVTSRVKLTLPIIPMLLAYEADYELRSNLNLWDVLKRIVKKINLRGAGGQAE
ncbi:MAG: TIR domain-containing protein [Calditrichaeota bacterium]|nr:TIR domain-containing protein [Calditrichota bacterium]MCB0294303.1 TIR domain-containing protein [Calditrichota bacterium]MCB0304069.1 TIR domain-containing protein [Calditrichota bacterium]